MVNVSEAHAVTKNPPEISSVKTKRYVKSSWVLNEFLGYCWSARVVEARQLRKASWRQEDDRSVKALATFFSSDGHGPSLTTLQKNHKLQQSPPPMWLNVAVRS